MKATITVHIESSLLEQVESLKARTGMSRDRIIGEALKNYVEAKKLMDNLQELTGQESGIIIYGNEAIICNWSSIDGLPRMFATGLIGTRDEIPEVEGEHLDDLSCYLPHGMTVHDYGHPETEEMPDSGTVYEISDAVTVIAPDGWA